MSSTSKDEHCERHCPYELACECECVGSYERCWVYTRKAQADLILK